ncbi:putative membrane protein [Melghirimyces profundicolus]|uniref:Putative membrane protein n=1 Tax=Melghirimyces profundicolus TaxID=1242148 RepID=A0A2T6BXB4_9BACL|nr:cytochrome c oxidase assembly protein [Melghirimyces profundicolus]PTX60721.1 putative membrane protein [Melghirimyces profundicolus]
MEALIGAFFTPGLWNVGFNWVVVSIGGLYLSATGRWRGQFPGSTPVPIGKKMLFLTGLALFYLALGSPIHPIGHELFSVHMLQQSILYLIMPPLLIRGIAPWMWKRILQTAPGKKWASWGKRPVVALLMFNGLFSLYHVPRVLDFLMGNEGYHLLSHGLLVLTATLMWWPVMTPLSEAEVLSPLKKMVYIAAAGWLLTPACALIIFADHLLFASYSGSAIFSVLSPENDQQLGGVTMKILQEITYAVALGHTFLQWVRREGEKDRYGIPDDEAVTEKKGETTDWIAPSPEGTGASRN